MHALITPHCPSWPLIAALIAALIAPHCPSMTLIAPLIATNAVNSETEPPRVVVFAPSANAAVELASRLQGAIFGTVTGDGSAGLWGLSVLLPSAESRLQATLNNDTNTLSVLESSLRVMEMFACNRTSVLVTTAAATRGLDFPQVT
jgi:hypothetical protein